jgi:malate dehydrogenase
MVEAILKDKQLVVPAAVYMNGQYGLNDIYFGAPAQLGRNGVEKIIEYDLSDNELEQLKRSAQGVAENIAKLNF